MRKGGKEERTGNGEAGGGEGGEDREKGFDLMGGVNGWGFAPRKSGTEAAILLFFFSATPQHATSSLE